MYTLAPSPTVMYPTVHTPQLSSIQKNAFNTYILLMLNIIINEYALDNGCGPEYKSFSNYEDEIENLELSYQTYFNI